MCNRGYRKKRFYVNMSIFWHQVIFKQVLTVYRENFRWIDIRKSSFHGLKITFSWRFLTDKVYVCLFSLNICSFRGRTKSERCKKFSFQIQLNRFKLISVCVLNSSTNATSSQYCWRESEFSYQTRISSLGFLYARRLKYKKPQQMPRDFNTAKSENLLPHS